MEDKTIYSKTARGFREVVNKTKGFPRELRRVLESVDGKSDFHALLKALDGYSEKALQQVISELIRDGYIRDPEEYRAPSVRPGAIARHPPLVSHAENEFDFTAMADPPSMPAAPTVDLAEAQARKEAEAQIQQEAEAEALRRAEEAQAAKEAKEKARLDAQREIEVRLEHDAEVKAKKDAEAVAQRQAEQELARKKIEALIRQEVEAKVRQEAEALAQRKVEEERLQREAEAMAAVDAAEQRRREIWAKSRLEAKIMAQRQAEEAQAKADAEALIRQEEAAKAQREADALTQRQAEEAQAKIAAAAQIRREREAKAQQEADALAQRKAEEKHAKKAAAAQKKAQAKMRREAAAKEKAEAKARARREAQELAEKKAYTDEMEKGFIVATPLPDRQNVRRTGTAWATGIASALASMHHALTEQFRKNQKVRRKLVRGAVFALFVGVAILHVISFDERLSVLEKTATAQFRQPVKAKALHFWLLPTPHWRLQDVTIGDQGQIRVALVKAKTSIGTLFSGQNAITLIEAESATLNPEGVSWILAGRAQANALGFPRIEVKGVQVSGPFGALPNFDANAAVDAHGNWQKIELRTPDRKFKAELDAMDNGARVTLNAAAYTVPLSLESVNPGEPDQLTLKNFSAAGVLVNKEFSVSEFSGEVHGGYVSGKARLNWSNGWTLNGEAQAKLLDTAAMFPALSEGGLLSGSGTFAMQAADPALLTASARAEGRFLVERGGLRGIDLGQALRGMGSGGRTPYATLDGKFAYSHGETQLRNVKMIDGMMTTTGNADISADKVISSRFFVELKSNFIHVRRAVSMTGTLDAPQFGR